MLSRRFFTRHVAVSLALSITMPALAHAEAEHADLEPDAGADDLPMPRRFMMEDAWGNVRTDEDFRGKFVLIYFGYTGCPDVCPTTLSAVATAMELLGDDATGLEVLFVTVDPDRDSARLLQDYSALFNERITPLRGPQEYTDHMVKTFNARYERHIEDPTHPERYSIDHTASVALLGPDGVLIKRYPYGTAPDAMAEDLRKVMTEAPAQ